MMGWLMITVGLLEDNKLMARHLGTILENWDFVSEVFYFETNAATVEGSVKVQ